MNAVARAQLTFQMLTLLQKYVLAECVGLFLRDNDTRKSQ